MTPHEPGSDPLVLPFAAISPGLHHLVGGKAANLGILTRAGLPVPPGVCVTTAAYALVVGERLDALLAERPGDLAARARAIVAAAPVPDDVADAIRATADGPVAVRSSATAEDLPTASFAGQQDTYLNVIGPEAVLDAVRRCWASLWTDRAVAYREANDVPHDAVKLAVVVQRMVEARVAGVMFTADPVTGRRGQIVIDAAPGLGESVVSGSVNPDHFVIAPTGEVIERRLGDKATVVRSLPGGGTETVASTVDGACLDDAELTALETLGRAVEAHYGSPQDTEWAIDAEGTAWLTQARPITTLYPLPDTMRPGARAFLNASVAQGVFRPFTPMGLSAMRAVTAGAARLFGLSFPPRRGAPVFGVSAGRVMVDATAALRNPIGRRILPRMLDVMEARSAAAFRVVLADPAFAVIPGSGRRAAARIARAVLRGGVPWRVLGAVARPARARERALAAHRALLGRLPAPAGATPAERVAHVDAALAGMFPGVVPRVIPAAGAGFLMFGLAAKLLGGRARPGELPVVLRALPHNVTTEMDLELWRVAAGLRDDPASVTWLAEREGPMPSRLRAALDGFLAVYGDRAVAEIDLGMPRWSDDPAHIVGVLANYLRLDEDAHAPDAVFARGGREATAMIAELAGRCGPLRGRLVRFALGRTRELAGLREYPKYWFVTVLAAARREIAVIGAELAAQGRLDAAGDVFFLDLDLLTSEADLRPVVAARREEYGRELRRKRLPRVLLSDGTEPEPPHEAAPGGSLTGTPASAGVVTGRARVVLDPVGAHLEPGEILVAPSTDPGWTPLFLTAGALVMEMGGANSHGAVVAREYGIPAVVGVRDATEAITTGQVITVDGGAGSVVIAETAPVPASRA